MPHVSGTMALDSTFLLLVSLQRNFFLANLAKLVSVSRNISRNYILLNENNQRYSKVLQRLAPPVTLSASQRAQSVTHVLQENMSERAKQLVLNELRNIYNHSRPRALLQKLSGLFQ